MVTISEIQPREVIGIFERISEIPRGSGNEKAVSDWIVAFAGRLGLIADQDEMYNVLIRKPGTADSGSAPTVILHGHIDMVCEKAEGATHDFLTDPIELIVDGDFITANGTSLGADNGVGVSYILALLASTDVPHPPLEAVLTVMEESGKIGGAHFDTTRLSGTRMIDFNWITDNQILAGCGGDLTLAIDFDAPTHDTPPGFLGRRISLGGLRGGHCEFDIHLERANAIVLLSRLLGQIAERMDVHLVEMSGGAQNNVIPAEASAVVMIAPDDSTTLSMMIESHSAVFAHEYAHADPTLRVDIEEVSRAETSSAPNLVRVLSRFATLAPNGVQSWSRQTPGIIETSTNLGTVRTENGRVRFMATITSGVGTRKHFVADQIRSAAELLGGAAQVYGLDAPEFPHDPDSELLQAARDAYAHAFDHLPETLVSNCSLELGMFTARLPGLDTISIGTDLTGLHSPAERVSHVSIARVWPYIKILMAKIA